MLDANKTGKGISHPELDVKREDRAYKGVVIGLISSYQAPCLNDLSHLEGFFYRKKKCKESEISSKLNLRCGTF